MCSSCFVKKLPVAKSLSPHAGNVNTLDAHVQPLSVKKKDYFLTDARQEQEHECFPALQHYLFDSLFI